MHGNHAPEGDSAHPGMYRRFIAMVATSTVLMFALTYVSVYSADHVFFSQTRLWMALLMGAAMSLVMLAFMRHMLKDRRRNAVVVAVAAGVFLLSLWLVRSQATVGDTAWMRAMIPHHSIAILTSRRADIRNPTARKLADEIIQSQEREIAEMKMLIEELDHAPAPPR